MTVTGKWTCAALAAVLVCTGCATQQPARHMVRAQSDTRAITLHAGQLTLQQEMTLDHLCPFGHPRHRQGWEHGFTELVVRDGYGLEHSGDYKIPLWVCERMDPARLDGPFQRKDSFKADPVLTGPDRNCATTRAALTIAATMRRRRTSPTTSSRCPSRSTCRTCRRRRQP